MFCMSDNTEYYDLSNTWLVIHGHVWSGMVTHHQSGTDLLQGSLDNRPGQSGTRELIRGTPILYTIDRIDRILALGAWCTDQP